MRLPRLLVLLLGISAACAPAPLYTSPPPAGAVTSGEIPRDSLGEPVWNRIPPAPTGFDPNAPRSWEDVGPVQQPG